MRIEYKILQRPMNLNTRQTYSRADYLATYKEVLDVLYINELELCEYLFEKFNINHPTNFASNSLSVGDAIELTYLDDKHKRVIYQCKSIGFEEIYRSNPDHEF